MNNESWTDCKKYLLFIYLLFWKFEISLNRPHNFAEVGVKIFELYGVDNTSFLKDKVSSEGGVVAWITLLAIAGFTPVPFKLLTITSGFVHFNIIYFIAIATATRGLRFFLIAFLIWNFGSTMKKIIEKKLLTVSIIFSIIIIVLAYFIYNFLINFTN